MTTAQDTEKIVIVGGGPAGYSAAIYAARAGYVPLLIEGMEPGGQLTTTTDVENYPGFASPISGPALMEQMRAQAERVGTRFENDLVESLDLSQRPFTVKTGERELTAEIVILATGAQAKWLGLESETAFRGRGVSACATCDGFFYRDQKVAVIGGGDTAAEEALYLTNHASEVILVHRRGELRASKILAKRVADNERITVKWHRELDEVLGDDRGVTGMRLKDPRNGETEDIALQGVFVAIGHRQHAYEHRRCLRRW